MKEFQGQFGKFLHYVLAAESHPLINLPCTCGTTDSMGTPQRRTCRCNDCLFFDPCCETCFIRKHQSSPFHWAEVWNGDFFERKDISKLCGHVITLGHDGHGGACLNLSSSVEFILVDLNGVHRTRLSFCECIGQSRERVDTLLDTQIFPATLGLPRMGFTFNLLKDFHLQTLTSKKSPYDYIAAIRRKTNNSFVGDVAVCFYFTPSILLLHVDRIHIHNFFESNVYGEL
jgi:hypothetical protein